MDFPHHFQPAPVGTQFQGSLGIIFGCLKVAHLAGFSLAGERARNCDWNMMKLDLTWFNQPISWNHSVSNKYGENQPIVVINIDSRSSNDDLENRKHHGKNRERERERDVKDASEMFFSCIQASSNFMGVPMDEKNIGLRPARCPVRQHLGAKHGVRICSAAQRWSP